MNEQMNQDYSMKQLGNYRIIRLLGQGSFASVYLGKHRYLNTQAAIKVLHIRPTYEEARSFHSEAQYLAHMRHPHIVPVLDFGVKDGMPFLIMEFASHGTLQRSFPPGNQQPLGKILPYILQIADALQYIHDRGLIHCDIKPANLLLGKRNEVWLSDFGIALQSGAQPQAQELRGTTAYLAPERIHGVTLPASDQYGLAVLVYEWLCGEHPFSGTTLQICHQHLYAAPPPLRHRRTAISPAVEYVVLKALAKDPARRFADVEEFAQALQQASQMRHQLVLTACSA
jgi:serine/threonine protein kinase